MAANRNSLISSMKGKNHTLVLSCIPIYVYAGSYYTIPLWKADFEQYFKYIQSIILIAPIKRQRPPDGSAEIEPSLYDRLILRHCPESIRNRDKIKLLYLIFRIYFSLRNASALCVVLSEHPVFYGFLFPILRKFKKTFSIVTYVESSTWRRKQNAPWFSLLWSFSEFMAKHAIQASTVSFVTQSQYHISLASQNITSKIIPPVWLDSTFRIPTETIDSSIQSRITSSGLKFCFLGRMTFDKGVDILLRAASIVQNSPLPTITFDIFGDGKELNAYKELATSLCLKNTRFMGTVNFGKELYSTLSTYSAIIVPNRSDENLRIISDAFSQGLAVIGSNVPGVNYNVRNYENGLIFQSGSAEELAEKIIELSSNPELHERLCKCSWESSESISIENMHKEKFLHMNKYCKNPSAFLKPEFK